jgi:hypothetical protein
MIRRAALLPLLALVGLGGCGESLPGGYTIHSADRGKAWLRNPNGTLAHGALIKQLFKDDRHVLLVTFAATVDGEVDGLRPLDGNCYIALLIETDRRRMRQVRLSEARRLAAKMEEVASSARSCLPGMPIS